MIVEGESKDFFFGHGEYNSKKSLLFEDILLQYDLVLPPRPNRDNEITLNS